MISLASKLTTKGLKKLIVLYSADLYKNFACYNYKRERQDLAKILQLLKALGKPAYRHRYCLYCTKRLKDLIGKVSCLEPRPNSWHLPYYFPAELDVSTCAFLINFPRRGVSSLSAFSGITALHAHESRLNRQLHFTLPGMGSFLRYKR